MGVRVFARSLLSLMPLDLAARPMQGFPLFLGAVGLLALRKLRRATGAARLFPAGYLVIAGCLSALRRAFFQRHAVLRAAGLRQLRLILISLALPLRDCLLRLSPPMRQVYGSLIAIFDTLTGGIPFALAMLPLLLALGFEGSLLASLSARSFSFGPAFVWPFSCLSDQTGVYGLVSQRRRVVFVFLVLSHVRRIAGGERNENDPRILAEPGTRIWSKLIALGSAISSPPSVLGALQPIHRSNLAHQTAVFIVHCSARFSARMLARRRSAFHRVGSGIPQSHRCASVYHLGANVASFRSPELRS